MIDVHILSALQDNYIYILRDEAAQLTAAIDPSESKPVTDFLSKKNWSLDLILNTHHHPDHVGGNIELKNKFNCPVYSSSYDLKRIPGATHSLKHENKLTFGASTFQIFEVPGHTLGAIAFYSKQDKLLFTGDTLFTLGCGRLFEGSAGELYTSLKKLAELPEDTQVYSGHEYGLQNAGFAHQENPQDIEIKGFYMDLATHIKQGGRSVPSTVEQEKRLNPFLRAKHLGEFTTLRRRKDDFRLENVDALG